MEHELGSHKDLHLNPPLFSCCVILGKLFTFPDLGFLFCKMNDTPGFKHREQELNVSCPQVAPGLTSLEAGHGSSLGIVY